MPRPRSEICDLKVPFPTERSVIPALLSVARFYPTAFGPAAVVRTNHDRQPHPGAAQNLGAGRAAPDEIARLYHQAFRDFGTPALWSRLPSTTPTIAQAPGDCREPAPRGQPAIARARGRDRAGLPCRSLKSRLKFFSYWPRSAIRKATLLALCRSIGHYLHTHPIIFATTSPMVSSTNAHMKADVKFAI